MVLFDWVSWNQNQSYHNGQSQDRKNNPNSQQELKVKTSRLPEARENGNDQVVTGFSSVHGLVEREWHECFRFNYRANNATQTKTKKFWITYDTELKIAPIYKRYSLDLLRLLLDIPLLLDALDLNSPPYATWLGTSSSGNATPSGNTVCSNMCASLNHMSVMLHMSHTVEWSPWLPAHDMSSMHSKSFFTCSLSVLLGTCLSRINWMLTCETNTTIIRATFIHEFASHAK